MGNWFSCISNSTDGKPVHHESDEQPEVGASSGQQAALDAYAKRYNSFLY